MRFMIIAMVCSLVLVAWAPSSWGMSISNIHLQPGPQSTVHFGDKVHISFEYKDIHAQNLRIFVRPYSKHRPSPRYSVHGSPLYARGSGDASGYFTINPGEPVTVDELRISVYGHPGNRKLLEVFLPVTYSFRPEPEREGKQLIPILHPVHDLRLPVTLPHIEHRSPEIRLEEVPHLKGRYVSFRPYLAEKLTARIPLKIPAGSEMVPYQYVPTIRPPANPPGVDQVWDEHMTTWLSQLNDILLTELELVLDQEGLVHDFLQFEDEEEVSVHEMVGLRLYFLGMTQKLRTQEIQNDPG